MAKQIGLKGTKLGSANATCDGHGRFTVKVKPTAAAKTGLGRLDRVGEDHGDARPGRPDRPDERDTDDQPQGQGTRAMNWERDGITRRSALTRGFGGIALVCSFDFDKKARTSGKRTSAYVRSAASTPFEPFQRDVPIPPVLTPSVGDEAARRSTRSR